MCSLAFLSPAAALASGKGGMGSVGTALISPAFGIGQALFGKNKPATTPTGQPFLGKPGTIQPTSPSPAGSSY